MDKSRNLLTGTDLAYLRGLIDVLERQSEAYHQEGRIVSGAELGQAARYLRRLLPADAS